MTTIMGVSHHFLFDFINNHNSVKKMRTKRSEFLAAGLQTLKLRDDTTADGQSDTGALIGIFTVQALEDLEDFLVMFRGYTDTIIAYGKDPFFLITIRAYVDSRLLSAAVLEGVADKIFHQLDQLRPVARHDG